MARRSRITMTGFTAFGKGLAFLARDLTNSEFDQMVDGIEEAKVKMIERISPWSFTGELVSSFVIEKGKSQKGKRVNLKNIAPHASALEGGVRPHMIHIGMNSKVRQWVGRRYNQSLISGTKDYGTATSIWVGKPGTQSKIIKGQSKRRFFGPVLDEVFSETNINKRTDTAIKNTIAKFNNRAQK